MIRSTTVGGYYFVGFYCPVHLTPFLCFLVFSSLEFGPLGCYVMLSGTCMVQINGADDDDDSLEAEAEESLSVQCCCTLFCGAKVLIGPSIMGRRVEFKREASLVGGARAS